MVEPEGVKGLSISDQCHNLFSQIEKDFDPEDKNWDGLVKGYSIKISEIFASNPVNSLNEDIQDIESEYTKAVLLSKLFVNGLDLF